MLTHYYLKSCLSWLLLTILEICKYREYPYLLYMPNREKDIAWGLLGICTIVCIGKGNKPRQDNIVETWKKKGNRIFTFFAPLIVRFSTLLTHHPWPTPRHSHLFPVNKFPVKSRIIKDNTSHLVPGKKE